MIVVYFTPAFVYKRKAEANARVFFFRLLSLLLEDVEGNAIVLSIGEKQRLMLGFLSLLLL